MIGFLKIFLLFSFQNVFVQCLIPALTVRKIDKRLVAQKRQDTLEICRLFNEDRLKMKEKVHIVPSRRVKRNAPFSSVFDVVDDGPAFFDTSADHSQHILRVKREISPLSYDRPALRDEDAKRIENIVDKLYDDVTEDGKKVSYRQRSLEPSTTTPTPKKINETVLSSNQSGRRFDFRPQLMLGPVARPKSVPLPAPMPGIPWIKVWSNGIVPYFIDPHTYDNILADKIVKAFDYFEKATCIRLQRLREKPTDLMSLSKVEWIYITNPNGIRQCVHSNERLPNRGVQMTVFGYDCMSLGEIVHEVMHILGFSHEHNRPDRDEYITVAWENIKPGYKKYFVVRQKDDLMQLPYDYASVLHYPPRAFSRNGDFTLSTKMNEKIGQREGLSQIDVEKVSLIFGFDCINRNNDYLFNTCPSVISSSKKQQVIASESEIVDYFRSRLWDFGVVNYKLRDAMEFSSDEKENILAVIEHIEKETCIEFRNDDEDDDPDYEDDDVHSEKLKHVNKNQDDEPLPGEIQSLNGDDATTFTSMWANMTGPDIESDVEHSPNTAIINATGPPPDLSSTSTPNASPKEKRVKRSVERSKKKKGRKSGRRHASSTLILARSPAPGCHCPSPGKPDSETVLTLGTDCFNSVNDLLHVFVHVLGLDHQHNMHDRDEYLHIMWDNLPKDIQADMEEKLPSAAAVGFPYDYQSVMHFPWLQIKNGTTTIMYPVWNDGWVMGHWQGLSLTDVQKINTLYYTQCLQRKEAEDEDNSKDGDNTDNKA